MAQRKNRLDLGGPTEEQSIVVQNDMSKPSVSRISSKWR